MRDFLPDLVASGMKSFFLVILVIASSGALRAAPKIVVSTESPALRLENLRIDQHDGKVRGTAYLNLGYAAPSWSHVDVYGLDASGRVIYHACDKLSRNLLAPHPRLGRGRDTFSVDLSRDLSGVATIRVVASSRSENCRMENDRVFKIL